MLSVSQDTSQETPIENPNILSASQETTRTVLCQDAVSWLKAQSQLQGAVVTSIPDYSELPWKSVANYKLWFVDAAILILSRLHNDYPAIFYNTDTRIVDKAGVCSEWIDKSYLLHVAAERTGRVLLWHKIATIDRHLTHKPRDTKHTDRVGYSHLLCFAAAGSTYAITKTSSLEFPDFFDRGNVVWHKGMGLQATLYAVQFAKSMGATCVVDPFCGKGTVLAAANYLQLRAIGVELNPKVARKAQKLGSEIFADAMSAPNLPPEVSLAPPTHLALVQRPPLLWTFLMCLLFLGVKKRVF